MIRCGRSVGPNGAAWGRGEVQGGRTRPAMRAADHPAGVKRWRASGGQSTRVSEQYDVIIDFWLTTDDVPKPDNRVTVDRDGHVHLGGGDLNRKLELQIMYGIGGERDLTERTLDLSGWRGARPVRVGNGAWNQQPGRCSSMRKKFDATTGQHLGNFPEAFTDLALIEAVSLLIESAPEGRSASVR